MKLKKYTIYILMLILMISMVTAIIPNGNESFGLESVINISYDLNVFDSVYNIDYLYDGNWNNITVSYLDKEIIGTSVLTGLTLPDSGYSNNMRRLPGTNTIIGVSSGGGIKNYMFTATFNETAKTLNYNSKLLNSTGQEVLTCGDRGHLDYGIALTNDYMYLSCNNQIIYKYQKNGSAYDLIDETSALPYINEGIFYKDGLIYYNTWFSSIPQRRIKTINATDLLTTTLEIRPDTTKCAVLSGMNSDFYFGCSYDGVKFRLINFDGVTKQILFMGGSVFSTLLTDNKIYNVKSPYTEITLQSKDYYLWDTTGLSTGDYKVRYSYENSTTISSWEESNDYFSLIWDCGNVTENVTLDANITYNCPNGFTILADNVVFNGNGATINGTGSGTGISVQADDITVQNVNIENFDNGLIFNNIVNLQVINNNFSNMDTAILSTSGNVNDTLIQNNNFVDINTLDSSIVIFGFADNLIIENNTYVNSISPLWLAGYDWGMFGGVDIPTLFINITVRNEVIINNNWGHAIDSSIFSNVKIYNNDYSLNNSGGDILGGVFVSGDASTGGKDGTANNLYVYNNTVRCGEYNRYCNSLNIEKISGNAGNVLIENNTVEGTIIFRTIDSGILRNNMFIEGYTSNGTSMFSGTLTIRNCPNCLIENNYFWGEVLDSSYASEIGNVITVYDSGATSENLTFRNNTFVGITNNAKISYLEGLGSYVPINKIIWENNQIEYRHYLLNSMNNNEFVGNTFTKTIIDSGVDTVWNSNIFNDDLIIQADRIFGSNALLQFNLGGIVLDTSNVTIDGNSAIINGSVSVLAVGVSLLNSDVGGVVLVNNSDFLGVGNTFRDTVTDVVVGSKFCDYNTYTRNNYVSYTGLNIPTCPTVTEFNGETTDWSNIDDWSNVTLILENDEGKIEYQENINFRNTTVSLDNKISIQHNSIEAEATEYTILNKPAIITFKNVNPTVEGRTKFKIKRNNVESIANDEYILSRGYNETSLTYAITVSGFSTYTIEYEEILMGNVLTGMVIMGSDMGGFLSNLAPGVGGFILLIGIFGGVASLVYIIAGALKKKIDNKYK